MDAVSSAEWHESRTCSLSRASISFRLAWIGRLLRSRFDTRAGALGMTGAQWRMIAEIHLSAGATQSDIASSLEISSATAGRIVDRLEGNGWLERRSDLADRRANRLFLKDGAVAMLEQLNALAVHEEGVALDGFTADERVRFAGFLDRLIDNMVAAAPSAPPLP